MSVFPPSEHYQNYLRYLKAWHAKPQPFTASQREPVPQYLPYAHYPTTPEEGGTAVTPLSLTKEPIR